MQDPHNYAQEDITYEIVKLLTPDPVPGIVFRKNEHVSAAKGHPGSAVGHLRLVNSTGCSA